eukprot:3011-Heterococcus_DN1.PRE.2
MATVVNNEHELMNQHTLPASKRDSRQSSPTSKVIQLGDVKDVDESALNGVNRLDNPAILSFKACVLLSVQFNKQTPFNVALLPVFLRPLCHSEDEKTTAAKSLQLCLVRLSLGSGKSTLLNTLALRLDRGVTVSGDLKLNGRDYDIAELKLVRYMTFSNLYALVHDDP